MQQSTIVSVAKPVRNCDIAYDQSVFSSQLHPAEEKTALLDEIVDYPLTQVPVGFISDATDPLSSDNFSGT